MNLPLYHLICVCFLGEHKRCGLVVVIEVHREHTVGVEQLFGFAAVVNIHRGLVKGVCTVVFCARDSDLAASVIFENKAEVIDIGVELGKLNRFAVYSGGGGDPFADDRRVFVFSAARKCKQCRKQRD